MKWYTVCLCFNYGECLQRTSELAKKNNAVDYIVEPVGVGYSLLLAYRGQILL